MINRLTWRHVQSSNVFVWSVVFIGCIVSRLLSTIYYIEDLDSLRFALSMYEYNVSKLQPHFPAYPVFCFVAKLFYLLLGRYALAFSLLGGISTFTIIYFTLKIARIEIHTLLGKIAIYVISITPLLWLMSNRYMPDVMGVACLVASLYFLTKEDRIKAKVLRNVCIGFFLAGLLTGIRLSYLPLLLPTLSCNFKHPNRLRSLVFGLQGILIWLIPLVWITGWGTLIDAAQIQSHGHFSEFGGTVSTNPDYLLRITKIFESLFADGFGLFWLGRNPITACTTILLIGILVYFSWYNKQLLVEKLHFIKNSILNPIFLGCILYLVWIFFVQNVIYKSRHILPLLPFLSLGIAYTCNGIVTKPDSKSTTDRNWSKGRSSLSWSIVTIFLICFSYVTFHTVIQHTKPTAIAQIHQYIRQKQVAQDKKLNIVSVPLIKYYLASQGVDANFITIKDETDFAKLNQIESGLYVIGSPLPKREPITETIFYHNPYVNRMWSELSLFEY